MKKKKDLTPKEAMAWSLQEAQSQKKALLDFMKSEEAQKLSIGEIQMLNREHSLLCQMIVVRTKRLGYYKE